YLLGKNLPGSGNLSRCSRSALTLQARATMPIMRPPIAAVLAFQFLGCEYQPPAGDQTCLGLRIDRLGAVRSFTRLAARPRPQCPFQQLQSTTSTPPNPPEVPAVKADPEVDLDHEDLVVGPPELESLPSPPVSAASRSAKLSALHARLSLPKRVPVQSLARTLVDPSADSNQDFNNAALATLGSDLMGYYTSEHIICQYPRLPMAVLFSAQNAYVGDKALCAVAREWGVETAAAPGGEVDPGLLQFTLLAPGTEFRPFKIDTNRPNERKGWGWRQSISNRIVYDDQFGESRGKETLPFQEEKLEGVTKEVASANFVRAVVGAVYVHAGRITAQQFISAHFLSRHLDMSKLFDFRTPTRDLSKLCAREGFEAPVARLLAETGRLSRHPVFVVGVYSGRDKLGEGAGASLDEGRVRAAAAALRSWYLYSPLEVTKPSEVEVTREGKTWVPNLVDMGEIVV
ncbi:uncharacterized protein K452DRAFT_237752, partial [Aplosporella prunicola CBS 121167]